MADSPNPEDVQPEVNLEDGAPGSNNPAASGESDATSAALEAAMDTVKNLRDETDEAAAAATPGDQSGEAGGVSSSASDQPAATGNPSGVTDGEQIAYPEFALGDSNGEASGINLLSKVNLNVRIELGRTKMLVEDVLRLNEGSVVELDKLAGDPVDIFVNDRMVACGEVLVLNDSFSVRINEIIGQTEAGKSQVPGGG